MKLSIVTITYNNLQGLKNTAANIQSQTWHDFEWIVIDGGSTDGTVDYIKSLDVKPDYWCSEQDKGIYDAQNKGIQIAKGEYVCCMNAGDTFCSDNTLKEVFNCNPKADVVYGDWKRIYINKEEICYAPKKMPPYFFFSNNICHQAMFVRTTLLQKSGFDLSYKIFADWAKWRQLMMEHCNFEYVPVTVCNFEANIGTCEQDTVLRKREYEKLAKEIPAATRKAITKYYNDIDVALIGFYPTNNGTTIWRLYFLQKILKEKGYNTVVTTYETKLQETLKVIHRAKKVIICRPRMDDFGRMVVEYCVRQHKSFAIDIDDALFHDVAQNDGCFMSAGAPLKNIKDGYNNIADCYTYAERMIVSTPKIKVMLLEKYGKDAIVQPNQIDIDLCNKKEHRQHIGMKMLYASGTPTHLHDFSTIYLDLISFMKRHEDVTLTILGESIKKEDMLWVKDRVYEIPYLPYKEMLKKISDYDLLLTPLASGAFNDAKSNIKYIESGAVGVAILASDCQEFNNAIKDGVNGFLFHNDFLNKLENIYKTKENLPQIGNNAYEDVKKNHSTICGITEELKKWLDNY